MTFQQETQVIQVWHSVYTSAFLQGHNTLRVDTTVEQSQTICVATSFSQKYNICNPEYFKKFVVMANCITEFWFEVFNILLKT